MTNAIAQNKRMSKKIVRGLAKIDLTGVEFRGMTCIPPEQSCSLTNTNLGSPP